MLETASRGEISLCDAEKQKGNWIGTSFFQYSVIII